MSRRTLTDDASEITAERAGPAVVLIATEGRPLVRVLPVPRGGAVTIGRALALPGGALELDDARASRSHAEVARDGAAWIVRDLDSHNGTFVDGRRLAGARIAAPDGAIVRTGASLFWLVGAATGFRDDGVVDDGEVVIGPRTRATIDAVERSAGAPTLLVLGETGTGKERLARTYHQRGPRAGGPFVAVNCAAIPTAIAERVLFGSRRGAYSGAEDAPGYVQAAHGGTLFLDELGELSLELQAKLLRVLERREVWPVGATRGIPVELGVVAATHRNLRAAVAAGRFRDDLYYRLTKPVVHVAPLRDRKDELPALARRALASIDPSLVAHPRFLEALCIRPWPGNVRELLHEVAAAATAARTARLAEVRIEHLAPDAGLPFAEDPASPAAASFATPTPPSPATPVSDGAELDRDTLAAALSAAGGNVSSAARALGLHRTQLYRLLERHGLGRDR